MVESRGIFLEHKGTKRYGLSGVQFYTILINLTMNIYIDVTGLRVKVDEKFGEVKEEVI